MKSKQTKTAKTTSKKARGAKQIEAPGFERPTTPAIEEAAGKLRGTRSEWQRLGRLMGDQQDELVDVMTKEGVNVYKFSAATDDGEEELVVKLSETKKKVSITKAKAPGAPKSEG